jgi:hypothetical protein
MSAPLSPFPTPRPGLAASKAGPSPWNVLPFPAPDHSLASPMKPAPLPAWPVMPATGEQQFPTSWPSPLSVLPSIKTDPATVKPAETPATPERPAAEPQQPAEKPRTQEPAAPQNDDFTDDDLREAFGPIVEDAVRKAVYAKENGIDTYLEPMLRATIRRALAEYAPASRPFQPPGAFDRFTWHVKALFTSRTYEDIFFEKTRRFQVEEVFLLDTSSLALVSFASCDPARHSSVRRVFNTVQRIALQLRDDEGAIRPSFKLGDERLVISRQGRHVVLVALVRGTPGELVLSDLEFSLRRIEDHFREKFQEEGSALLYALQPFLEDCLLIQSPASAA